MPWKVEAKNGRYAVVKKGTGAVVAYHDTQQQASAQVRALYAKVPESDISKPKKNKSAKQDRLRNAAARRASNPPKKYSSKKMPGV
jgi:hypothetical protein